MNDDVIKISEHRTQHMLAVARKCYNLARVVYGESEEFARRMFLIGYLHDIGYEFTADSRKHPEAAYNILKDAFGVEIESIKTHGNPDNAGNSLESRILNIADLTTNSKGEDVSISERLNDIKNTYGEESRQYNNAKKLADKLHLK